MRFSVITISFNNRDQIEHTLSSVLQQRGVELEYVLQDGGSTDGTAERIACLIQNKRCASLESTRDRGIYDALNKALARTTGEVIGFVHAGDFLVDPDVLQSLGREFALDPSVLCVYGNKLYCAENDVNRIVRYWKSRQIDSDAFRAGHMPPHQALYFRRPVYEQIGGFREELTIAADYEWLLRVFVLHAFVTKYINRDIVVMRANGVSNRSFSSIWRSNRQARRAWILNGMQPPTLLGLRKVLTKLPQLFRRPLTESGK